MAEERLKHGYAPPYIGYISGSGVGLPEPMIKGGAPVIAPRLVE